jgi:hypothetical protein
MYKSEFGLEKYFTILPPDLMYNMCIFRCGSHKLPIEMGRFFSIDRSERICDLCNKEELGDEFQYSKVFFQTKLRFIHSIISTFRCIKDLQFPILNIRIIKVLLNFLR